MFCWSVNELFSLWLAQRESTIRRLYPIEISTSIADSNNNILLNVCQFNSCIYCKGSKPLLPLAQFSITLILSSLYYRLPNPIVLRRELWKINIVSRLLHAVPTPASKSHMWSFSPKQCSIKDLNQQETKKFQMLKSMTNPLEVTTKNP